ncbi:hypothetical protein TWF694_006074 [Orbilia ellipsospora]|uniref:Uncharacterized protein n=1 Tax=Orbilia ellipsospora TaxID=2528407 RepID=A0AAV9WS69_9PEZI
MRLSYVLENLGNIIIVKKDYPDWFTISGGKGGDNHYLYELSYRFENPQPLTQASLKIDVEAVWKRFASGQDGEILERTGTTKIVSFWDWVLKDPKMARCIFIEFDMYQYHLSIGASEAIGWLRNSYHSLAQQLCYQDPAYWALVTVSRPDLRWWLLSFPYYQKYALPGQGTYFSHVDLNINEWLKCCRGANRMQTSISLDQETAEDCTFCVEGGHKTLEAFWRNEVIAKNLDKNGNTAKMSDLYTKPMEDKYGKSIPIVCGPGDLRITNQAVIHGATATKNGSAPGKKVRRVLNAWLVGMDDDHNTLEIPQLGNWETISRLHRDLLPSKHTPSGNINYHHPPKQRFPAAIEFRGLGPIPDARIGQRRWDSPAVFEDAQALLGGEEYSAQAEQIIATFRQNVRNRYVAEFQKMRRTEINAYGTNSYFKAVREGRWIPTRKRLDNGGGVWPWNPTRKRHGDFDIEATDDVSDM